MSRRWSGQIPARQWVGTDQARRPEQAGSASLATASGDRRAGSSRGRRGRSARAGTSTPAGAPDGDRVAEGGRVPTAQAAGAAGRQPGGAVRQAVGSTGDRPRAARVGGQARAARSEPLAAAAAAAGRRRRGPGRLMSASRSAADATSAGAPTARPSRGRRPRGRRARRLIAGSGPDRRRSVRRRQPVLGGTSRDARASRPGEVLGTVLPRVGVLLRVERPVRAAPGAVPGRPLPGRGERLLVGPVVARRADRGLRAAGSAESTRRRTRAPPSARAARGAPAAVPGPAPASGPGCRAGGSGSGAAAAGRPRRRPRSGRRPPGAPAPPVDRRARARYASRVARARDGVGLPRLPRRLRRARGRPGRARPRRRPGSSTSAS